MISNRERDMNLMVVAAIEGYAYRHGITTGETYWTFRIHNVINMIRMNYMELYNLDTDQYIDYCDEILRRAIYGE